ncbi:hypothetical protein GCM10009678_89170 [Actinomadura kijaniata]|uniref:Mce-associated membrane protein n=1 Tax=Actinomadura namibiensis TaxID=182080 RepID=A0A7W3QSE7_ACTNM|nr:hypothetical protein [Actinomadura namibiensis]MBA8957760.1 Mce-associated membrane protein [Actinomadura namibiensis]
MTTTEEKARKAAEQAERAAEAARAAKAAEEAAEAAKAAARNALKAAEQAAAEAGLIDDEERDEPPAAEVATEKADAKKTAAEKAAEKTEADEAEDSAGDGTDAVAEDATVETAGEPARDADEEPAGAPKAKKSVGLRKRRRTAPADAETGAEDAAGAVEAEEGDEAEEDGEEAEAAKAPRSRRPGFTLLSGVLVAVIVALVVGGTVLGLEFREQKAVEKARQQAVLASNRAAQDLSSYDYRTLDGDFKAATDQTTGKLRQQYDKLAQQLKTQAVAQQAVATTTVIKVGVVSATPDKVVTLVYANRSTATKDDKEKRLPEALRIRMTMQKAGDRWLASDLVVLS